MTGPHDDADEWRRPVLSARRTVVEGSARIDLAVVDDHPAIGVALRARFARDPRFAVVAHAGTVDALLAGSGVAPPVTVLDLRLGDRSAPQANVHRLRAAGSAVVAYTSAEDPFLLRAVARSGIAGLVRKSEPLEALVAAVDLAARGVPQLDPASAAALLSDPDARDAHLSRREAQILARFADGCTADRVALEHAVALATVEDAVRRIREKYAAAGRRAATKVDLYKRAVQDGFLPIPER